MKHTKDKPPKKPAPVAVEPIHARAVKPPTDRDARWYWRAEVHEDGATRTVWTGRATIAELRQALAAKVASGKIEKEAPHVGTVKDLLELWLGHRQEQLEIGEIAHNTHAAEMARAKHIAPALGHLPTAALQGRLEAYKRDRLRAGAAASTVRMEITILGAVWTWGRREGLVADVVLHLPTVSGEVREGYTPTAEEAEAVIQRLSGRVRRAAVLQRATGARIGEVLSLRWADVSLTTIRLDSGDREAACLTVGGKTGRRQVWVTAPDALEILREGGEPDASVVGFSGTAQASNLNAALTVACAALGQPRWSSHALRRLAVDQLYSSGVDPIVAAKLLGHSPEVAMQHYRRPRPADLVGAVATAGLGEVRGGQVLRFEARKR